MQAQRNYRIKKHEQGFSLIELLIVMVILGMLAALVGPNVVKWIEPSKQKTAKTQITMFEGVLEEYRLEVGKYPTSEMGLIALREKPSGVEKWNGPYLKKELPKDPWGNAYVYVYPGEHGDYDIISYGADGSPGGEGDDRDIVSWKGIDAE